MKNSISILIILVVLISCQTKSEDNTQALQQEIKPSASIINRGEEKVKFGPIQSRSYQQKVQCTGKVEIPPTDKIAIHSKIEGSIEFMKYLPGDYIQKGSLLFKIANPEILIQQRELLETAEKLSFANKEYERKAELFNAGAINEKEFLAVESNKKLLTASYTGLKKELYILGVNTETLLEKMEFQASIPIYARNSGYVQEVNIVKGQYISTQEPLMIMANNDHIHLELQVLSKDVPLISKGQMVEFTLPKNEKTLNAEIVKVNPIINADNGTLQVYCHINNEDCNFTIPGMFVNATINVSDLEVQGLPLNALIKESQEYFAYKKNAEGLEKILIKNAEIKDDFVVFKASDQDTFVIAGAYYVE